MNGFRIYQDQADARNARNIHLETSLDGISWSVQHTMELANQREASNGRVDITPVIAQYARIFIIDNH
jgi:hypothetical protein